MRKLTVNGRYLFWDNGEPFFYLADTAWELFHCADREDAEYYFSQRSRQGFNVAQIVALAEFDGLFQPNTYGRLPLRLNNGCPDPELPDTDGDYSYWDHVDYIVGLASKYNMFISLLPTWGDKFNIAHGKGPEIFNERNAYIYGKWIAERYKDCENIIWMLGGDRGLDIPLHRAIIDSMAKGIREIDKDHLITFHPPGNKTSLDYLADAEYIDFHTSQTGHGVEQCYKTDSVMLKMAEISRKPYMDSEPRYEDHPACFDENIGYYWDDADIRQNAYWNMTAGVCGYTYGNHCIWSMNKEPSKYFPFNWRDALLHKGAEQMIHFRDLRLSHDFESLHPFNDLISSNYEGMGHISAAKGKDYAFIYTPLGLPFNAKLGCFDNAKRIKALWFDPRNGNTEILGVLPANGINTFVPPTQGKGNDWLLILEVI